MSKILIIDDEEANVRVLSISLRSDGHEVVTAYSGEEGLQVFKRERPDIVLTDIKMPGMNGIEVLEEIKAMAPEAEVIIITGHGDIENAIEALKYGASDFINKPIRDEAMSIAIQRAQEKIAIRCKLRAYTDNLECEVQTATRELRRQSSFLTKLITSAEEGIVATDAQFQVVIFNPAAERIFGFDRDEVISLAKAGDLYPAEVTEAFKTVMGDYLPHKELIWDETLISSKKGHQIPVRFWGTVLYENHQVMGSVAFLEDLREIKRLKSELVRSERLAAIGQTVASVAHDVKNILHGFKGGSYLVNLGIERSDETKLKNGWQMIQKNICRTSELVMDLLSYSRDRQPEYEGCIPNEIAQEVWDLMEPTAREHNIELVKDFDTSIGKVLMDPQTIHRCLLNLMSNALDACIENGENVRQYRVSLKTRLESGQIIRFDVADNGSGMSAEVKEKIFNSFFSTKGHHGTGLGLLVTRKLIEEHKGAIEVISELGKGTQFTMRLPYRQIDPPSAKEALSEPSS